MKRKMNIKTGDTVQVIAGKDKGKQGTVTEIMPEQEKVIVEGANMRKRHQKPRRAGQKGQVVAFAAPIAVSNVSLLDPKTNVPTRVGRKIENGKRVRIAKKSGAEV